MNTATVEATTGLLLIALAQRELAPADVYLADAAEFAAEIEAYEGRAFGPADWDYVINNHSVSGRVIC